MRTGTKYLDTLTMQLRNAVQNPEMRKASLTRFMTERNRGRRVDYDSGKWAATYLAMLEDPNTKRVLFDARQAALFDEMLEEEMPERMIGKIHPPFERVYIELTEPIMLSFQDPEHQDDMLRAILVFDDGLKATVVTGDETYEVPSQQVVFFLSNTAEEGKVIVFVDRAFHMSYQTGLALSDIRTTMQDPEPSTWPDDFIADTKQYVISGVQIEGYERTIGWWERLTMSYTNLVLWMFAYTMAKSVHIVAQVPSRQVRRWHARKNIPLPAPWHVIEVEPKFYTSGGEFEETRGRRHRYRYDVIGHLRFGHHKRGDGTYNDTIEWVPPHQRGLEHSLYIPKTYKVDRGKVIAPAMREYMGNVPTKGD